MAGRADIQAGRAFVELFIKNSAFLKGLQGAKAQLQAFGSNVTALGGALTAIGAAALAPMMAAVHKFAESGDQIAKMARRTGVSTEALSELGFAAEQSGQNIDVLEQTLKKMQKTIGGAELKSGEAAGLTSFEGKLAHLGLTIADLKDLAPDQQFEAIADRIAAIPDPTQRAAAAMEIFGKSGTALLPLMEKGAAGIRALRQEARDLGLSKSQASTKVAEDLVEAFNRLRRVTGSTVSALGAALAPEMLRILEIQKNIVMAARNWIKAHADQAVTVFRVLKTLALVGTVVTAIGAGIVAVSTALGAVGTIVTSVGTIVGLLLSPVTLVVGAILGGVYAWARFTQSGQAAVNAIRNFLAPLLKTIQDTIGGIGDALMSGDFQLAGQIAVKGLQLVFLQGLESIASGIGGILGAAIGDVGTRLLQGDLKGAWETVVKGMAKVWADFAEGIVAIFTLASRAVVDAWQKTQNTITHSLLEQSAKGGVLGKIASMILGVDMQAEQRKADELNSKLGLGPQNVTEDAKRAAREQSRATAVAARRWLDGLDRSFQEQSNAAGAELGDRLAKGGPSEAVKQLEQELAELRKQASAARDAAKGATNVGAPGPFPELASIGGSVSSAFSAGGALALGFGGGGGGPQERIAKAAEATTKKLDVLHQDVVSLKEKIAGLVPRAT